MPQAENDSQQKQGKNALEWTVALAGAAIVLFVLGFFSYQILTGADEPADLVITLGTPQVKAQVAEIPVTVHNRGDRVAEAAIIEVCSGPSACAQLTFDYVPFHSTQTGRVGLPLPLADSLRTRVVSFRDP